MGRIKFILATLLIAVLQVLSVSAKEIRDIDVTVRLQKDGSAVITQRWDLTIDEGTEWYVPVGNLNNMSISDLRVSENGKLFASDGNRWDSGRTRSEKQGRCGIVEKSDGIELCWGIGEYGDHIWEVTFTITGLVQAMDDYDILHFQFINQDLQPLPKHVKMTLVNETGGELWTSENVRVWGFGMEGEINVVDGTVVQESSEAFTSSSNSLISLIRFDKGLLSPDVVRGGQFDKVLNKALEQSSYEEKVDLWANFFVAIFFVVGHGFLLWMIIQLISGKKFLQRMFGTRRIKGWFREPALKGNIPANQFVIENGKRFVNTESYSNNLIGAYFLKWLLDGFITSAPDPKKAKNVVLIFNSDVNPVFEDKVEKDLYDMALAAAGGNRVLEAKEFESWARTHASKIYAWPGRVVTTGEKWLTQNGYLTKKMGQFSAPPERQEELRRVIEFKNFIKDYTLIPERASSEVGLWKEYLIFGQLYGMADKVAKQFKKLFPGEFAQLQESVGGTDLMKTVLLAEALSRRSYSTASNKVNASRSSGGGGRTSFGGGGGFSGGGRGGGAR